MHVHGNGFVHVKICVVIFSTLILQEFSFGRSLFSRLGRGHVQQEQLAQRPVTGGKDAQGIWGVSPDWKGPSGTNPTSPITLEHKKSRRRKLKSQYDHIHKLTFSPSLCP